MAMAVAGVVVLGTLYAIGDSGCCGPGVSKPVTGYATWARPSNPWIFGQAPKPAGKPKADKGASGRNLNPGGGVVALGPPGNGALPPAPDGSGQVGDSSGPNFPLPPGGTDGGSGNSPSPNPCSPVIEVLPGLAPAVCAGTGGSDHNDSSGDHHSSGNNHSSNQGDSPQNSNANATALATGPAANDNGNGRSNGNANGADNGNKDHGEKSQAKNHSNGRGGGNKHH
jgi:hypothetical protein